MTLNFTKANVSVMAEVLDRDYETVEEAARAALDAAMEIAAKRAKYTVVGQINGNGDKVALGWYPTEKQAREDALRLAYSHITHEEARAWVLPIHHNTPHSWYKVRKEAAKADDLADASYRERELQRRIEWCRNHPDEPLPLDWTVEIASEADTSECEACGGVGRVPRDDIPRRESLDRTYN